MNRLFIIVFVITTQLLFANQLYSCTCGVIPQTLCESINGEDYQEVVLVNVISFNFIQDSWGFIEEVTQAEVIFGVTDNSLTGDTITIYSGNGGSCQGSLYEPSDTMLLVLTKRQVDNEYTYPLCGKYSAGYRNDSLFYRTGSILIQVPFTTYVDNFDNCISIKPRMNIEGRVVTWRYGTEIADIDFTIDTTNLTTGPNGEFEYFGVGYEGPEAEYRIYASSNDDLTRGISNLDLVLMSKHILGTERFFRTEQYIAADINNSKSITTLDLIYLRRVILGIDIAFPNNNSWRFIKRGYQFPDLGMPWSEEVPEYGTTWIITEELINITADLIELSPVELIAIKIGDIDGNL